MDLKFGMMCAHGRWRRGLGAVALLTLGCVDSTAPRLSERAMVSRGIAADVGEAIASVVAPRGAVGAASTVSLTARPDSQGSTVGCARIDGGWYKCSDFHIGGLTITRSYCYWDGATCALSLSAATEYVKRIHHVVGTFTRGSGKKVWINRADTATIRLAPTGLARIIDATGTRNDSSLVVAAGVATMLAHVASDTVRGLTIARDRAASPWPLSGTLVSAMTTTASIRDAAGTRTHPDLKNRVVVVFSGVRIVPLRVGDVSCELDLQSHHVFNCR